MMKLYQVEEKVEIRQGDIIGTRGALASLSTVAAWREAGPIEAIFHRRVAAHILGCITRGMYIEATFPRVREISSAYINDRVCFVWRPRNVDILAMTVFAKSKVGAKYDTSAWSAMYGVGKQCSKKWYCSELWAAALASGCYSIPPEWRIACTPWNIQMHAESVGDILWRSEPMWWNVTTER